MPLTFLEIQDEVQMAVDVDDSTTLAIIKNFINRSARAIWTAHPWTERRKEGELRTFAPYSTGTVTATNGSATITGSGTTFPTTYTATLFRFGLDYTGPFYPVTSRDSGTGLTLSANYHEATVSGSAYVLWQDVYRLATDVDTLIDIRLHKEGQDGPLALTTESRLDSVAYAPRFSDSPKVLAMTAPSSAGVKQVRLWPVPDTTYRLPYRYLSAYTDMTADADECVVPENMRDIIVMGTLRWAWGFKNQYAKSLQCERAFRGMIAEAWAQQKPLAPLPGRIKPFDDARKVRDTWDLSTIVLS